MRLGSWLARWRKKRRDARHAPTGLADTIRESQGPTVRDVMGMPLSAQHDIVEDSWERYTQSFRRGDS